ncbi:amino acid ABC transporter substrate-binding protein [Paenibacillus crassostreae]|uniref:Amino acid ABC transporter substrate-binding protein n=2 Tax=Paenibacillus crassostreae TaxID=1763538 RepID=A0A167DYA6_9BACL|nr:amino acid ABC transporter substrate-binding protein [Paenibacillus crassostreae]OAB74922.1 amino acid ABC transporter substrate-binding protein [Paenibacillus crassostreae]
MIVFLLSTVILLTTGLQTTETVSAESETKKVYKELILGTSAEFAPYEFHKTIDGKDQIVGFDIAIAEEIAKDLGAKLVIEDMGFDSLLSALQSGRVDFVISGLTPTEERLKSIDFSDNYYVAHQVIVVRAEDQAKYPTMKELEGEKIGVQKGSIQEEIGMTIPNADLTSLDKIPDLILQLETNRINAIIVEDTVAEGYLDSEIVLADAEPEDAESLAAIGIQKGNTELLNAVNDTLTRLKSNGDIERMVKEASLLAAGKEKSGNILDVAWKYRSYYIQGIGYTLLLSALGVLFGFIIGLFISLLRMTNIGIVKWLGTAYVEVLRGTPMLVQLMIIHYGMALTFGINFSPLQSGIITLSINSSAYLAEIFRAGIQGVDRGQMEAARSLGMKRGTAMRHIILPQAFKAVLPAIGNEFITIIKESSIISVIGMADIMYQAGVVKNITYKGLSPFIIAAAIYFVMTFALSKLLSVVERKLSASDNR